MKRIAVMILFTGFCLVLTNCKSDKTTSKNTDGENVEQPVITQDEVVFYRVMVDKLRLRTEAGTKSEVVAKLEEGSKLKYLNAKSDFTTALELRGSKYDEPWLKVETSDGKLGWIYGGAVERMEDIVGMRRLTKAQMDKSLSDFKVFLSHLDKSNPRAVQSAHSEFLSTIQNAPSKLRDETFYAYYEFHQLVADQIQRDLDTKYDSEKIKNYVGDKANLNALGLMEKNLINEMSLNGFEFQTRNKVIYVSNKPDHYGTCCFTFVSRTMQNMINQLEEEQTNPTIEGGKLGIPQMKLVDRCAWWERHLEGISSEAYFGPAKEIESRIKNLQRLMFAGTSELSIYDENQKINASARQVLERFKTKYPTTPTGALATRYLELLQASNFRKDETITAFLGRNDLQ